MTAVTVAAVVHAHAVAITHAAVSGAHVSIRGGQALLVELRAQVGAGGEHLAAQFADFPGQAFNLGLVGRGAAHLGVQLGLPGDQRLTHGVHLGVMAVKNPVGLLLLFRRDGGIVAGAASPAALTARLADAGNTQNKYRRQGQRCCTQSCLFHGILPEGWCAEPLRYAQFGICVSVCLYGFGLLSRIKQSVCRL